MSNISYSRRLTARFAEFGRLRLNLILATDVYKLSHMFAYPINVIGMFSYQEARTKHDIIVPFGMQMLLAKTLANPITVEDIDEAEEFCKRTNALFSREPWEYIIKEYGGFLPVTIKTVREGTPVPSGNAIVTVECTDRKVFWLASYIETFLLRGIWYTTTIASQGRLIKQELAHLYRISGGNMDILAFALNDFGARGVTCAEQAEAGGAAHMVNFCGSDTIEGIRAAGAYYNDENPSIIAVAATEHSIECSYGLDEEGEDEYLENVLTRIARPGSLVSIVIDGKDVKRCARRLCTKFKDLIIASGCKVVFRPDSGDMMEIVPWILNLQAETFGYDVNELGFKRIRYVGCIQGDGIDIMTSRSLIGKIVALGYVADSVVLGSGGGLLQKVNRDTYKFAQKASAILVEVADGIYGAGSAPLPTDRDTTQFAVKAQWVGIAKDPITDPGKKSKMGRLGLAKSRLTGEFITYDIDKGLDSEFEDQLVLVYENGILYNETTLSEIRTRAAV